MPPPPIRCADWRRAHQGQCGRHWRGLGRPKRTSPPISLCQSRHRDIEILVRRVERCAMIFHHLAKDLTVLTPHFPQLMLPGISVSIQYPLDTGRNTGRDPVCEVVDHLSIILEVVIFIALCLIFAAGDAKLCILWDGAGAPVAEAGLL